MNNLGCHLPDVGSKSYRGKCFEKSSEAVRKDPSLTLVRGHYLCLFLNEKIQHWWTVRSDGTIYDPTKNQFISGGVGDYIPFDGTCECEQCGNKHPEENSIMHGRYPLCSMSCLFEFVGLSQSMEVRKWKGEIV